MATLATNVITLSDVAKRMDPDGNIAAIVEMLSQTNEVLTDAHWAEGNLPTGHRVTMRTGYPTVAWRLLNQGVTPSKSTTAQVDESCGMLEGWSEVDKDIAELNGNTPQFRLSEARATIEALNQEMASTLFYGNTTTDPEEFLGLSIRYSSLSANNARNIIDETCTQWSNPWMTVRKRSWTSHTKTAVLAGSSLSGRGGASAACAADMDRDERTRRVAGRVTMRSGFRFDRPSAAVEGVGA